ncbi:MAG TPA: helix-turn-helix domain-containing protein, partial [Gemmatimonadaceae bacterium]|nr:helix-turn-helix domain-containing protein [Gemmatimonadaceae bacterium]
ALRNDPLYTQLWSSLPTSQQKSLLALLGEEGQGLASTQVSQRYGLPITTMHKALKALDAKGITREEQRLGLVRTRLEDPFFGAWIGLVVRR